MKIISILICTAIMAMWALSGCTTAPISRGPAAAAHLINVENVVGWKTTDESGRDLGDSYTVTFRVLIEPEGLPCQEAARSYQVEADETLADLDVLSERAVAGKCAFNVQFGFPKSEGTMKLKLHKGSRTIDQMSMNFPYEM